MNLEELKAFLEENKENEEVKNVLGEYAPAKEVEMDLEKVKGFIEEREQNKDEEVLNFLNSKADTRVNQGIETFKKGKMEELFEERLNELSKNETPEQKELREEREQRKQLEHKIKMNELTNMAKDFANENKLPSEIVTYLVGQDEDTTKKRLQSFQKQWRANLQTAVDEKIKGEGFEPPKGDEGKTFTMDEIEKMTPEEINKNWDAIKNSQN